ncbi:hypothetical protein [Oligella urethralis]|nr:hypothetical protein [Oligella urethralis]
MVHLSSHFLGAGALIASTFLMPLSYAQSNSSPISNAAQFEEQRQQQRDAFQQSQLQTQEDVRLESRLQSTASGTLSSLGQESP